jgi:hypothetical protein
MSPTELTPERDRHRPADDLIRAIYEKRAPWAAAQTAHQDKVKSALATVREQSDNGGALDAWQRLRRRLGWQQPDLLTIEPICSFLGPQAGNTGLDALLHLALCYPRWLRPPEEWEPGSHDLPARDALGALARHLLARYDVPAFLDVGLVRGLQRARSRAPRLVRPRRRGPKHSHRPPTARSLDQDAGALFLAGS